MKKLLKPILVVLLAVILFSANSVFAVTSGSIKLGNKAECKAGETFTVSVNFQNFTSDDNIVVFSGEIEFDTNQLELVGITSNTAAGWPEASEGDNYSKTERTFTLVRTSGKVEANSRVFDITFKAKENFEGTANITLKDVDIADGNFANASTTIKVSKEATTPTTPSTPSTNKPSSNTSKNDTTVNSNNKSLPKAGVTSEVIMPIIGVVLMALVVFFYIQNKKVDRKIKELNKKD